MCNTEDCLHYDYVRLAWDVGFTFEEYDRGGFDISVIGLVDVEKVAKDRDIPTVVKHIPTLLQFRLDNDFGKVLEPNFIKLFRLAQLSIQYLIFCKKYLDSTVALMKSEFVDLDNEKNEMEMFLEELKSENDEITRKYEELKATLSTSIYKCEQCSKTFYSEEYLLAHIKRRHQVHNTQMQTEADKLQLEIKELKQRLNNTERLVLKDESDKDCNEKDDVISPKECAGINSIEKKEQESFEPNNDAVLENSIQFKFEQLKNHIETEINSLKGEDFYKNICEKYIKERVENTLTEKINSQTVDNASQTKTEQKTKDVLTETETIGTSTVNLMTQGVESCTQTDIVRTELVSEGTSMSPKPKPRNIRSTAPTSDLGSGPSDQSTSNTPIKSLRQTATETIAKSLPEEKHNGENMVMRTIEEKLAKEAELQRETLEHILDLKLSGSLNKMEAQMSAFWQKLNAWESSLAFTKSNSVPSVNVNAVHRENVQLTRQNSVGSIVDSPVNKHKEETPRLHRPSVPKALPRKLTNQTTNKSPVLVAPKPLEPSVVLKQDVTKFLDSSDDEDATITNNSDNLKSSNSSESSSEEEPSNMKPSDSFKKHLDETLLQRLNSVQTKQSIPDVPMHNVTEKTVPKLERSETKDSIHKNRNEITKLHRNHKKSLKTNLEHNVSDDNHGDTVPDFKEMKKRLKRHVEDSVNQKLKDIGVSPHWKCLPEKSYAKAMQIVEHQATLSKKNIHDFHKIRKNIERAIDKEITKPSEDKQISPVLVRNDRRSVKKPLNSLESLDGLPLQRITGQAMLNKTINRRGSLQSDTSNSTYTLEPKSKQQSLKTQPLPQIPPGKAKTGNKKTEEIAQKPITIVQPEEPTDVEVAPFDTPSGTTNDSVPPSITKSLPPNPPQNQKKKVLFNLDSDTEQSQQSPIKQTQVQVHASKDLGAFVQQERNKLDIEKQTKSKYNKNLDLHTASESSDWDISDIT